MYRFCYLLAVFLLLPTTAALAQQRPTSSLNLPSYASPQYAPSQSPQKEARGWGESDRSAQRSWRSEQGGAEAQLQEQRPARTEIRRWEASRRAPSLDAFAQNAPVTNNNGSSCNAANPANGGCVQYCNANPGAPECDRLYEYCRQNPNRGRCRDLNVDPVPVSGLGWLLLAGVGYAGHRRLRSPEEEEDAEKEEDAA